METADVTSGRSDGRVAHVEPQRQENTRQVNRRRRGRRSGQLVRERQQADTPNTTPAGSAGALMVSITAPAGSAGALSSRSGRLLAPQRLLRRRYCVTRRALAMIHHACRESRNRRRRPRSAP